MRFCCLVVIIALHVIQNVKLVHLQKLVNGTKKTKNLNSLYLDFFDIYLDELFAHFANSHKYC